ncbi:hypothetical protein J6590_100384 [Homalodisca vitripennis]|nr:hypothetical protein J6590_100384 [Homalodisca vitripennis]
MSTERERADCQFHYSNTRAISSWQEGPLHPHSFSPPRMITPLNTHVRSSCNLPANQHWPERKRRIISCSYVDIYECSHDLSYNVGSILKDVFLCSPEVQGGIFDAHTNGQRHFHLTSDHVPDVVQHDEEEINEDGMADQSESEDPVEDFRIFGSQELIEEQFEMIFHSDWCQSRANRETSPGTLSLLNHLRYRAAGDDLDHDTSLSLAAEVGNALLTENTLLKQQLYDLKTQRSESQLELEDKIKLAEEITGELRGKISMLEKEMEFIKTKLKSECKLREDIIQQSENEKCCLSTQINNVLSTNSDLRNKIKQLEDETTDKSLLINSLDDENCQLKGGKHNLEIELEENKSLVKAIASNYKEILTKVSEQESTARKHLKHLENILKAANPQLLSHLPHETTHHLNTQKNKHIYSTSLKVAKNKILQLQCPTLEEELAQENPTPEKIQVNTTERDNSTLTNRADERDTNKCRQTFIKHPPHNSFIRSHGESYEDFLSDHINSYKDLIIMNTSCYNIEHNTSPSLENKEDKNQDNFLVKAKQPKEKHKSYINYKTVTFWNQDYKKILMNKNTNKLGQK